MAKTKCKETELIAQVDRSRSALERIHEAFKVLNDNGFEVKYSLVVFDKLNNWAYYIESKSSRISFDWFSVLNGLKETSKRLYREYFQSKQQETDPEMGEGIL